MRRVALLVAVGVLAGGCSLTGVTFRQDDRLSFVTPDDRAEVSLPLTVRWEVEDFDVGPDGSFAVFVDRAPQPPGKSIEWLARDDDACRPDDGCPDDEWFAERDVFITTDLELTIEQLPAGTDDRRERHEVTVVLLDPDRRRIGETAWSLEFEVEREDAR